MTIMTVINGSFSYLIHLIFYIAAQKAIAGPNKGISKNLITLDVVSEDVPDLTLIDLPGITRVAVEDQPRDIGDQVVTLFIFLNKLNNFHFQNKFQSHRNLLLQIIRQVSKIYRTEYIIQPPQYSLHILMCFTQHKKPKKLDKIIHVCGFQW